MNKKQKKKGAYKRTGNRTVDMVAACIMHYQYFKKNLKFIRLQRPYWLEFCAYVQQQIPGYDFSDGTVDFDGVLITEGSALMNKILYVECEKEPAKIILLN